MSKYAAKAKIYFSSHNKTAGTPYETGIPAVICFYILFIRLFVIYNEHESGRVNDKTVCVLCNVFKRSVIHDNSVPFIL